jgi:phospholipid transport system substrate-binding protein
MRGKLFALVAAVVAGLALGAAPPAIAQQKAAPANSALVAQVEAFTAENVPKALAAVTDSATSPEVRRQRFAEQMDRFGDVSKIARQVIGVHARAFRTDPALELEWRAAFRDYAFTFYESELDRFGGAKIAVAPGRTTVRTTQSGTTLAEVITIMTLPKGGKEEVRWRVEQTADKTGWKCQDIAVNVDGSVIWLGVAQNRDFVDQLNAMNGDIRKFIVEVKRQTGAMRQRIAANRASRRG